MPLARQNALKPLPTSDSLPAFPSNRSSSKVSLKILLAHGIHVAGGKIQGELEVSVKDKALGLGEIGIELNGTEELRNRDHTATKRILYSRLMFQGPQLPPSNAVVAGSSPSQGGYFPALRGRTRFGFSFDLPKDLPSTCSFGANAVVRYELRAFVSSLFEGEVDLKSEKKETLVVERWEDWRKGNWSTGVEKEADQEARGREGGLVSVRASIGKDPSSGSLPRLFWWRDVDEGVEGKGSIEVRVRINNQTKRHIPGMKVCLIRRLRLQRDRGREGPAPPQLSATVTTVDFLGTDYDVRAGSEREILVALQLPKQECWTGRKGTLFDLDCFVHVQVEGSFLDQKLFLELPVWISHPFSISNTANRLVESERRKRSVPAELPPSPSVPFLRSPRSPLDFSSTSAQPPRDSSDVARPHQLGLSQGMYHYAGSDVSTLAAAHPYHTPSAQPSFSAAGPPQSDYNPSSNWLPPPHNGYVAIDPAQPDLTPSRFFGSLQAQQPGQVYGAHDSSAFNAAIGPSQSPLPHPYHSQAQQNFPPPPSLAQPPVPPLDSHPSRQPSPCQAPSPLVAAIQPLESYSAISRAHQDPRTAGLHSPSSPRSPLPRDASPAPAMYIPETTSLPPSCPSPAPRLPPLEQSSSYPAPRTPLRTPPPPSPSSQFRHQSPASSYVSSTTQQQLETNALDTIGEDGESQAGTAKSHALTASALAALRDDDDSSSIHSVRVGNSPGRTSVQDLEELVEEEERKNKAGRGQRQEDAVQAASLPKPTTSKVSPKTIPRAQDVFRHCDAQSSSLPKPSPTSPSPGLSAPPTSGLAALQARLARSTSPLQQPFHSSSPGVSRSPSPSKVTERTTSPALQAPALDVPKAGGSALRARSLSRSSRNRDKDLEKALREAEEDPAEAVKKALTSASWSKAIAVEPTPPPNVSSAVFRAVTAMKSLEIAPMEAANLTSKVVENPSQTQIDQVRLVERVEPPFIVNSEDHRSIPPDEVPFRVASPPSRPPSRPIFGSSPSKRDTLPSLPLASLCAVVPPIDLSSPVEERMPRPQAASSSRQDEEHALPHVNERGRKVVDTGEVKELKKEAVLRIGDRLQTEPKTAVISPWSSMSRTNSNRDLVSERKPITFGRSAPAPPSFESPSFALKNVPTSEAPTIRPTIQSTKEPTTEGPTVAQLLAAESRAELRRIESLQSEISLVARGLSEFLAATKRDEEFEPKYHSSSARGGKGGKVTNVASIWASREEGVARVPVPSHKSTKSLSSLDKAPSQPLSSVGNAASRPNRRSLQVVAAPVAAKPFLNTTLGRSVAPLNSTPRSPAKVVSRPATSENERVRSTVNPSVKDLLSKWQQIA
ncbi:hypothetical protein JCM16303_006449 [Sporobolomyces ruberrimus]